MKRIAIDMDDVMADTLQRKIDWYERDFGIKVDPAVTDGYYFPNYVPKEHQPVVWKYSQHPDFFKNLKVKKDCPEVFKALQEKYDVIIVTAAITYPNSFIEKITWLQEYFPFFDIYNLIYCGRKDTILADYLIDDSENNIIDFPAEGVVYTAPHNVDLEGYKRVNNWEEIAKMFL